MASLDALVSALESIQHTKYALFGSTTVVFYDYLISFDQEVQFVWKREWSLVKIIFVWHRYFGISNAILQIAATMSNSLTDDFCSFWFRWQTWGYCAVVFSTEVVVILWIFVVYNKDFRILALIGALFTSEVVAVIVLLAKSSGALDRVKAESLLGTFVCALEDEPQFFKSIWTPILVYNGFLLVLFLYRGYRVYNRGVARDWKNMGLLARLYQDSLWNFLMIFASYLACAIMWLVAPIRLAQIPVGFVLSLSIINSTRLLLNIRHAYYTRATQEAEKSDIQTEIESQDTQIMHICAPPPIYAVEATRDIWTLELRELKWTGF